MHIRKCYNMESQNTGPRLSRSVFRSLACIVLASILGWGAAAEETKLIQGMYLSVSGTETRKNFDSPFARLDPNTGWNLESGVYSNFSLRFQTRQVYAQVSASAQGDAQASLSISIDQAWVKVTLGEGWGTIFGRRELNWKDGGYWNPSDVVNNSQAWDAATFAGGGQVPGKDSIELIGLLPFQDFNIDLSAATVLSSGSAQNPLENPLKLPLYLAFGSILYPIELRAKLAMQDGHQPLVGASAKLSLSSGNIYADGLWLQDKPLAGALDPSVSARGTWFRYCAGADWSFDLSPTKLASSLGLRLEYLRQDDGLSTVQMKTFFEELSSIDPTVRKSEYDAAAGLWGGRFFSLGRDYLLASIDLGEIAQIHLGLSSSCVINLDDRSVALQNSLRWSPKNLFAISFSASHYFGPDSSEARMLPSRSTYSLSLSRSF